MERGDGESDCRRDVEQLYDARVDTTSYWVRVSNAGGMADSSTATVTVVGTTGDHDTAAEPDD